MMKAQVLFALLLLLGAASAPMCDENLALNPDFEDGTPGPGVADFWMDYFMMPPPSDYFIMDTAGTPWAVYSGNQSQNWQGYDAHEGGIFQMIADVEPGAEYGAEVYFGDPDPGGPFGPTQFRIGIEPQGLDPRDPMATVQWSAWEPVTGSWELAEVTTTALGTEITVVMESSNVPPGMPTPHRVIVDNGFVFRVFNKVNNVPDTQQPPNDPLGTGDVTNYCGPMAAVNITDYWDAPGFAPGVNAGLVPNTAAAYIGYWMDTNNDGCPYRSNGTVFNPPAGSGGTYTGDLAPGIAQYARWDAANSFGCTPPPNLPAGKNGYSWAVSSVFRGVNNLQALWNQLVNEINGGRPMIVSWSFWKPIDSGVVVNGIRFYTWGAPTGSGEHGEEWNNDSTPGAGPGLIGHDTTAVGYWNNYDHDGNGVRDKWVIVHDNWPSTVKDVAIPWKNAAGFSPWACNTTVNLAAPNVGALTEGSGNNSPKDHWGFINKDNVMIQLKLTETSGNEGVRVNAVELTAMGTGDDQNDISNVKLYHDANSDGKLDGGDTWLASSNSGYPANNGTMTIIIEGPGLLIPAGATRNMLVVYTMNANGSHGDTYKFLRPTLYVTGDTTYLPVNVNVLLFLTPQKKLSTMSLEAGEPCPQIPWWKEHPDGTFGIIVDCTPIISCEGGIYGNTLYVQEDDRTGGIMIDFGDETPPPLPPGIALEFAGYIDTLLGERVIVQPEVLGYYAAAVPKPVGMAGKSVGGGDYQYNPGTGAGQKGILDAYGLNNIGLLVKTCGLVTAAYIGTPPELSWFKITDGSPDEVKVVVPLGMPPLTPGECVSVAGICSCEESGGDLLRLIKVRTSSDIKVESP